MPSIVQKDGFVKYYFTYFEIKSKLLGLLIIMWRTKMKRYTLEVRDGLWHVTEGETGGATISATQVNLDGSCVWLQNKTNSLIVYANRAYIKHGVLYLERRNENI